MGAGWRRALLTAHRWLGLTCAVIFVFTAASGLTLMYQRELGLHGVRLERPTESLAGLDRAMAEIAARHPDDFLRGLRPPDDPGRSWDVLVTPRTGAADGWRSVSVDPESGTILADRANLATPYGLLLALHHQLLAGPWGEAVMLLVAAELLLLAITGPVMMQRRWRTLRANPLAAADRWRALHRWAGLLIAAPIVVWAVTAWIMQAKTVADAIEQAPKPVTQAAPVLPVPLATLLAAEPVRAAGELNYVLLPTSLVPALIVVTLDRDAPPWAKFTTLVLDPASGRVLARKVEREAPPWDRARLSAAALHTGQLDALPLHLIYLVAVPLPLLMAVSGPVMWWRRRRTTSGRARR